MNFQPISFGTELPEVTFERISIADRDLIWQAWFRFLNFVFRLVVDSIDLWKYVCVIMTYRPHICASKLKSVRNRPTVVRYREHWAHCWGCCLSNFCLVDSFRVFFPHALRKKNNKQNTTTTQTDRQTNKQTNKTHYKGPCNMNS